MGAGENRSRFLYDKAPVMLHSSDASGRLVSVSDHWLKVLGYERGEVIGQPLAKFLTEESQKQTEEVCFPAFMKTGVLTDEALQFRKKNAEIVDVLLSAIAERDADGNIARSLAVSIDVTDRKRAEEAVKRYTKRVETLQEIDRAILAARSPEAIANAAVSRIGELMPCLHALVGIFEPNGDFVIKATYSEGGTERRPGFRLPASDFEVPNPLWKARLERVEDILSQPETPLRDLLIREGLRSWIGVPLRAGGELIGLLHVDSERRGAFSGEQVEIANEVADSVAVGIQQTRLLEQVKRQAAELEERVAERTKELETFSYSISHDLRNPLRAIDGFSRVLWEDHAGQLDDEGRRLLGIIRQNAKHMGQLIEDLLAFFGLSRREMHPTEIQMTDLVKEAFDELKMTLPKAGYRLDLKSLPPAYGDRSMMRQVFVNLLSNAVKFTEPKPSPVIEIGHEHRDAEGVYFVRDNGVGFDGRYADKLFGVFQRLHSADQFEGTGLGLAITHRIIQRHGGRVWAEGELNRGATVFFTLPSQAS